MQSFSHNSTFESKSILPMDYEMGAQQKIEALKPKLSNQKSVVAVIPRGEVIRNFVYSNALDYVAAEADLSLLSVSPNRELIKMLEELYGNVFHLNEVDERWIVRIQREILETAHNRWLWSKAAQQRSRLRDSEARTLGQKTKRAIKKAVSFAFATRPGLRTLSTTERLSSRIFRTTNEYLTLMKKLNPSLVFNGSHIHSAIATQAVQAAQWLKIPTATFVFSWDNLTSQGRIMLPYDYYLVWNEAMREQLLDLYRWIREDQVFVTGTPQFDFHFQPEYYASREEFCRNIGADPSRPIVLYSTGMANHMPDEQEIVEEIADFLRETNPENPPQLLVRVYGKDLTGRFEELKGRRTDILFPLVEWEPSWLTPKFEDSYALVNSLRHCAFGINVASTISLELCMFDKPVINIGYNPRKIDIKDLSFANYYQFDHYRPIVESGAVDVAWNREEMRQLISRALNEPGRCSNERRSLIRKMFGDTLDGNSAHRVANVLSEVVGRAKRRK